jgi:hypothetical protein
MRLAEGGDAGGDEGGEKDGKRKRGKGQRTEAKGAKPPLSSVPPAPTRCRGSRQMGPLELGQWRVPNVGSGV